MRTLGLQILLLASLLQNARPQDDSAQKVTIEANETWQSGVVLIYSTVILIALRLSSTVRHSPLSPLGSILRIYYYGAIALAVGLASTILLLFLSIFDATRNVGRDLMPCASPLLALGGFLALLSQSRAPQMDAQPIAALMGISNWVAFLAALLFNALTIAASAINGAWAATSISLATSLIVIFGPRTPVVSYTVGKGIIEPGGPLLFRVAQFPPDKVITLSLTSSATNVREFTGPGWAKLPTGKELSHEGCLRIGARPVVSAVVVNEENLELPILSERQHDTVQLISGVTGDVVGYFPLSDWMNGPFGEEVFNVRIRMTDFFLEILRRSTWSASSRNSEVHLFPGAYTTYGNILHQLLLPVPPPNHEALGLGIGVIDLSQDMYSQLNDYQNKLIRIDHLTTTLSQPHRNIVRIVLKVICSRLYDVHETGIADLALHVIARVLKTNCRIQHQDANVQELCVIFDGIHEVLFDAEDHMDEPHQRLHALVTDLEQGRVHWIFEDDRGSLETYLSKKSHLILTDERHNHLIKGKAEENLPPHLQVITLSIAQNDTGAKDSGRNAIRLHHTTIPEQEAKAWDTDEHIITESEWNESRRRNTARVWPVNWDSHVPETASVVATVKGIAEICSLQAITSGIAAGSVLLGRLLGA